jgi:hypothetical protein
LLRDGDCARLGGRLADPGHLREVEFDAGQSDELVVDQTGIEGADGEAVGARGIDRVGAHQMSGAGKIAHHERGAGQVALHVFGHQPAIEIIAAAGRGRDNVGDGLAFEVIGVVLCQCRAGDCRRHQAAGEREAHCGPGHHLPPIQCRVPAS